MKKNSKKHQKKQSNNRKKEEQQQQQQQQQQQLPAEEKNDPSELATTICDYLARTGGLSRLLSANGPFFKPKPNPIQPKRYFRRTHIIKNENMENIPYHFPSGRRCIAEFLLCRSGTRSAAVALPRPRQQQQQKQQHGNHIKSYRESTVCPTSR